MTQHSTSTLETLMAQRNQINEQIAAIEGSKALAAEDARAARMKQKKELYAKWNAEGWPDQRLPGGAWIKDNKLHFKRTAYNEPDSFEEFEGDKDLEEHGYGDVFTDEVHNAIHYALFEVDFEIIIDLKTGETELKFLGGYSE